jgi:hypothetical protein
VTRLQTGIAATIVQLGLLFFYIYDHNKAIGLSYHKQKNSLLLEQATTHKKELEQTLETLKNYDAIQTYAGAQLGLQPIRLDTIRAL